jgi:hypothetical protein
MILISITHLPEEAPMRRRHTQIFATAVIAAFLAIAAHPATAYATSYQYALNRQVGDFTTVSSATGTVAGGKVQLVGTTPPGFRVVIQTYTSVGILYASSGTGTVSFTHSARSGVKSRCYWYYTGGPVGGTVPLNCWRYA